MWRRAHLRRGWCGPALLLAVACNSASPPPTVSTPPEVVGVGGVGGTGPVAVLSDASPRRIRRLSAREYDNVVRDLLGDTSSPARRFIPDAFQNGYDNGSVGLAVQSDQVVTYQAAAEGLAAAAVADRLGQLLNDCDVEGKGEAACADEFLNTFVARAFRRPPTATELRRLRNVYENAAEIGGFLLGIQTALEAILQSPQFLYREELGPATALATPGQTVQLTDYEIASELSFLLTGSSPDDALWSAILAGNFKTNADYRREAERLLENPGARATLQAFLRQWLATDRLASLTKDPLIYPAFTPTLAASMSSELEHFFDAVLWQGEGSLRELFTSSKGFADVGLGQLYGVPTSGDGFQPVALDPAIRAGVLSRAGFLAVHSATDSSGPIARGVFALQALLCVQPPAPPQNVPAATPASDPSVQGLTTRQRFAAHVSTPFCAGCHALIDGVGLGFEQFDGLGVYRTTEKGQPVDSSGELLGTTDIDGPYDGLTQLTTKLATSQQLRDCFVKQVYRYGMGQMEPSDDAPVLGELAQDFSSSARLVTVLLNLVQSPSFVTRRFEPESARSAP